MRDFTNGYHFSWASLAISHFLRRSSSLPTHDSILRISPLAMAIFLVFPLALLGGLLAHFLFGMIDAVSLGAKPGFLFWWLLGMVFGLYDQCRGVRGKQA